MAKARRRGHTKMTRRNKMKWRVSAFELKQRRGMRYFYIVRKDMDSRQLIWSF